LRMGKELARCPAEPPAAFQLGVTRTRALMDRFVWR
jgi:hypothetical protein